MYYWLIFALHVVVMTLALVHALIYKRDHRAALGWIGMIIVFPIVGVVLYFVFGINRIRTKARVFAGQHLPFLYFGHERPEKLREARAAQLQSPENPMALAGERVTGAPLLGGNQIEMLINGEQFFPRLITAVDGARECVLLSSYLFSAQGVAREVIEALCRAARRGVRVHVLIDGIGACYSLYRAVAPLRRAGVQVALFLPPSLFPPSLGINLRNHRKIVVVDGTIGYFGGINIDQRHMVEAVGNRHPTEDVHFEARGLLLGDLQAIFAADWWLAAGQPLEDLAPPEDVLGTTACRVIDDGPHESLDYLAMTLLGVFSAAQREINIMVPYFLPSREMCAALQAAKLRGVKVRVVLPERSNLRYVDWATRNMLWELLVWDVEVYYKGAPFSHAKLITIDDQYVLGGSANLDARSLRLNFELGVEMFDSILAAQVHNHIEQAVRQSHRVSLEELDKRPFPQRLRDAFFWLFSSYL